MSEVNTRVCSVDGCDNPLRARGYCTTHWARWRKYGTHELPKRVRHSACVIEGCSDKPRSALSEYCEMHYTRIRRRGTADDLFRVTGQCATNGCEADARAWGNTAGRPGEVFCRLHYLRLKNRGDENFTFTGENNNQWTGDAATNQAVHQRIRKHRGKATNYACVDCGGQAAHWSYDHTAPDEKFCPEKGPYTTREEHYEPRCVPCHKRFDLNWIKGEAQRYA